MLDKHSEQIYKDRLIDNKSKQKNGKVLDRHGDQKDN